MHVLSIKTGLKLVALLVLGILLMLSLLLLVYKSYKSLTGAKTTSTTTEIPAPGDRANAKSSLALLLNPKTYHFVSSYHDADGHMEIRVDGNLWKQLPSAEKKSYLHDLASVRSVLGLKSDVKIIDMRTSIEMSSYDHGRVMLGEDQDGS